MESDTLAILGAVLGAVAVVALAFLLVVRSKRRKGEAQTAELRDGFGPEYARTVDAQGRSEGERDLLERKERDADLKLRKLSPAEVTQYSERWAATQAQFVDDPGAALTATDRLILEVVASRGYPADEFENSASALSVDHPRVVQEYRAAHETVAAHQRNAIPTDDLRTAMKQYQSVFTELLEAA